MVKTEDLKFFTIQTDYPQDILSDILVCYGTVTVCIARQLWPLVYGIRERLRQLWMLHTAD